MTVANRWRRHITHRKSGCRAPFNLVPSKDLFYSLSSDLWQPAEPLIMNTLYWYIGSYKVGWELVFRWHWYRSHRKSSIETNTDAVSTQNTNHTKYLNFISLNANRNSPLIINLSPANSRNRWSFRVQHCLRDSSAPTCQPSPCSLFACTV